MDEPVGSIFDGRFPREMVRIDASFMTLAAGMCRLMLGRRGRAFEPFANIPASQSINAVYPQMAITVREPRKRPRQALIANFIWVQRQKELKRLSLRRATTQRVAMAQKTAMMRVAQSARFHRLAAAVDRTYTGDSHFRCSNHRLWSGPTRCFQHQIGPLFIGKNPFIS
jgi:hypothetical protein